MSMLRRPLTQLKLCEDDIDWFERQMSMLQRYHNHPVTNLEDEPDLETEEMEVDRPIKEEVISDEDQMNTSPPPEEGDAASFQTPAPRRTTRSTASSSSATPVVASTSTERRQTRSRRGQETESSPSTSTGARPMIPRAVVGAMLLNAVTPETPSNMFATPANPSNQPSTSDEGGPSSNTRSRHPH